MLSNTPVGYWGRPTSSVEPPCPSHRHTNDEPTIRPIGFLHDALGQCVDAGHRGVEDGQMHVSGIECVSGGWREGGGVGGQTMTMKTRRYTYGTTRTMFRVNNVGFTLVVIRIIRMTLARYDDLQI